MSASSWLVVVARAWRDGDRQMIRLAARGGADEIRRVAVESSNRAAAERLFAWLEELAGADSAEPRQTARPTNQETHG